MRPYKQAFLALVSLCGFSANVALAQINQIETGYQSPWQRGGWESRGGGYVGAGANTGSGWEPNGSGYVGTGTNTGGGWEQTGNGYAGTGRNVGSGYATTNDGMVGTGRNTGGGWARTGRGVCVGTGSNAGQSFQHPNC